MSCLAFSSEDFPNVPKFSNFVKHVLSGRDNQREVSSVKVTFCAKARQVFVKRILKYAFSHNVQQRSVTLTSTWEVPALTTLHLDRVTLSRDVADNFSGLISKCVNLKNLTLTKCHLVRSNNIDFNIFHSQLSNLTIDKVCWNVRLISVSAPQLKNLIIRRYSFDSTGIMISAPDLAYLLLQCYDCLKFSADDFHSLEKADISISEPYREDPQNIVGLFQLLHSVKDLTLNLEIL
ncbi:F-box domain, Leucine-rich repeat domain, L domain-like protein [Artemisia annua]|uniref:F-box domain, Leucine-rich repeat domain, L domain-like protein n=1 Tax=Artemisia annua TaxID=35608 RepID=A0A2U1ME60_ARTAN|nr:F-box domain, Leucine-rich repeat domain, L domain-like protein [Artemisia annua]